MSSSRADRNPQSCQSSPLTIGLNSVGSFCQTTLDIARSAALRRHARLSCAQNLKSCPLKLLHLLASFCQNSKGSITATSQRNQSVPTRLKTQASVNTDTNWVRFAENASLTILDCNYRSLLLSMIARIARSRNGTGFVAVQLADFWKNSAHCLGSALWLLGGVAGSFGRASTGCATNLQIHADLSLGEAKILGTPSLPNTVTRSISATRTRRTRARSSSASAASRASSIVI